MTANSTRNNQQNTIAVSETMALPADLQRIDKGGQGNVIEKVFATAEASRRQKEGEARPETPDLKKLSAYEYLNHVLDQTAAKKESAKK
jgi:hypothetical protein